MKRDRGAITRACKHGQVALSYQRGSSGVRSVGGGIDLRGTGGAHVRYTPATEEFAADVMGQVGSFF